MASEPIPIYRGQDFYVPAFQVKVGDEPLKRDVIHDILSVSYKDNLKEIDSFEIVINNWDAGQRDFKYSDSGLFNPGKKVELWMGYFGRDRLRLMLTGEITSLRPAFPSGGQPTLSISGLNLMHRLRKKQESRSYTQLTDNQIARQIASRLNVSIETPGQDDEKHNLFQDNQYDIIFLMERARHIGYDLFVVENGQNGQAGQSKLHFGPSQTVRRVTYELEYGKSLIEFQPNLTTANQVGQVVVRGWDPVRKKKIEVTVSRNQITNRGVGSRGGQAQIESAFNQREEIIANQPIASETEARRLARETLENIAKDMIKASGSIVGLPDLRAGNLVRLKGLGKRFSGQYFITATSHTIGDGGYLTHFDCRREETS